MSVGRRVGFCLGWWRTEHLVTYQLALFCKLKLIYQWIYQQNTSSKLSHFLKTPEQLFTLSICISFWGGRPDSLNKKTTTPARLLDIKTSQIEHFFLISAGKLHWDDFFRWGCSHEWIHSLKLTASSHLKMDGWKMKSPFGMAYFRGYVSFREGTWIFFEKSTCR